MKSRKNYRLAILAACTSLLPAMAVKADVNNGDVTVTNSTLSNPYTNNGTLTIGGIVDGGPLTNNGTLQFVRPSGPVTTASTFTGTITSSGTVAAGTLQGSNQAGVLTGGGTLAGGIFLRGDRSVRISTSPFTFGNVTTSGTASGSFFVTSGATLTIPVNITATYKGGSSLDIDPSAGGLIINGTLSFENGQLSDSATNTQLNGNIILGAGGAPSRFSAPPTGTGTITNGSGLSMAGDGTFGGNIILQNGTFTHPAGNLTYSGSLTGPGFIEDDAAISFPSGLTVSSGQLFTVKGATATASSSSISIMGTVRGNGHLAGAVDIGGTLNGPNSLGLTPGLTIDGSLKFESTSTFETSFLRFPDGSPAIDTTLVHGPAQLGGSLDLDTGVFLPDPGARYDLLDADSITGSFLNATDGQLFPTSLGGIYLQYHQTPTSLFVTTAVLPEPTGLALFGGTASIMMLRRAKRRSHS